MKRSAFAALMVLALAGCASQQERPEGIVERWLLALNQGSAGEPGRYAPASVSDAVLAGWQDLDPGELDVIEVGPAISGACREGMLVPFRVVPLDGEKLVAAACVDGSRITALTDTPGVGTPVFPSEGGAPAHGTSGPAWWAAVVAGVGLAVAGEAAMRLVRVRRSG